ncbi:MAG: lysylphosphatidylglycerol synthase transmembrane domain-containing protein [Planctomycetota bacterium]
MFAKPSQIVKIFIRITITIVLLVWVISRIDLPPLGEFFSSAHLGFLAMVWAFTLLTFVVRSIKMRIILQKQGCDVMIRTLFAASSVTSLYSLIMPGPLSTGVKWYILKKNTGKGTNVLSGMVYNQVSEILVMIALGLVGLILINAGSKPRISLLCGLVLAGLLVCSALFLTRKVGDRIRAALLVFFRFLPHAMRSRAEEIVEQLHVFQTISWFFHIKIAIICALGGVLSIVVYVLAAKAAHIDVPIGILVCQTSLIFILGRFPISLGDLGVREYTLVETMSRYGVSAPAALLMSGMIFSTILLLAGIGACCQLFWSVRRRDQNSRI